ncbi:hypothetical protein ACTWPT_58350 [Nonomuraea sp. 3N208]|uniref:hypothetical protein n=1 Tax=Nonomuraea sp. 3N208 TaxID=3457421 RepID=UPI003FD65BDC
MRFPVDTSQLGFTVTSPPSPAKDFTTKKVRVTEDGRPVMVVNLLAMDGNDSTKIKFNLPGEQNHLKPGQSVRVGAVLRHGQGRRGAVVEHRCRDPAQRGSGDGAVRLRAVRSCVGAREQRREHGRCGAGA